ncbi:MAG: aminopeptidase N, partial [bacterium]
MAAPNLTRDQAQQRAALLEVESYSIELDLTDGTGHPGESTFASRSTVRFTSREVGASTFVDLVGAVESAELNGVALDVSGFDEEQGLALTDHAESN